MDEGELFKRLVENHSDILWYFDSDLILRYISPRIQAVSGLVPKELMGKSLQHIHSLFARSPPLADLVNSMESHSQLRSLIGVMVTKDHGTIVLESNGRPFYSSDGTFLGYIGYTIDITEKKRKEGDLRKRQYQFKDLVEGLPEIIWEMDFRGNLTYVSPQVRTILGYEPEEVIGYSIADMIADNAYHNPSSPQMVSLRSMKPFTSVPMSMRKKDGSAIVLENSGAPVIDDAGQFKGYRGSLRDVTAMKAQQARQNWVSDLSKAIWENIPLPCYSVEAKSNQVLYISRLLIDLLGMSPLQTKGEGTGLKDTDLTKYFMAKVEDKAGFKLRPMPRGAGDVRSVEDLKMSDGRILRRTCLFIRDAHDELLGRNIFFSILDDEAAAVRASNVGLAGLIVRDLHLGLVGLSTEGLVMYMNPAAERILGTKLDEARGHPLQNFVSIQNTKGLGLGQPLILSGMDVRKAFRKELFLVRRDGSIRTVECSIDICALPNEGIRTILTITERSGLEERMNYPTGAKG